MSRHDLFLNPGLKSSLTHPPEGISKSVWTKAKRSRTRSRRSAWRRRRGCFMIVTPQKQRRFAGTGVWAWFLDCSGACSCVTSGVRDLSQDLIWVWRCLPGCSMVCPVPPDSHTTLQPHNAAITLSHHTHTHRSPYARFYLDAELRIQVNP